MPTAPSTFLVALNYISYCRKTHSEGVSNSSEGRTESYPSGDTMVFRTLGMMKDCWELSMR